MGPSSVVAASSAFAVVLAASSAVAQAERSVAPIPEPLLSETVTDIDGVDPGEIEVEANGTFLRARSGGAYADAVSAELEWLATRRLGMRLEPTLGERRDPGTDAHHRDVGVSAGASWKLYQDVPHSFHLQLEALARLPWEKSPVVEPGDPEMPLATDLRGAFRSGPLTVRASAGYGFGHEPAHTPMRASLALLTPFDGEGRLGFFGVEADVDGARAKPLVCALDIVPSLASLGLPFRLGLAVPWAVGEHAREPSLGLLVRLFVESDRENDFARGDD